ncbi:gluconate 2-dehydrogenase subunit 3 family protein [Heyndrickxia oleronia]|uniref:gluconate 2-dehydrogenase subunit 3 family protein n=1 Tax=Heyndrickxia oleronia TaxID=38875 RepID=UPI00203E2D76|nr:gluconate 2-dehydrogenase subunit 3 family protein [Heyndrickxia oleronia]
MSDKKNQNGVQDSSRRVFLKNSGLTVGGIIVGGALGSLIGKKPSSKPASTMSGGHEMSGSSNPSRALMYFTKQEDFTTIEAAAEQIFPKTDVGPGAKDLDVAYYIDHQLAGNWGLNTKEYMSGPFSPADSVPELGYQTHLKRHEIFDLGIQALNDTAQKKHKKKFHELEGDQQIAILKDFEADKVKLNGATTASNFFALLRKATLEGAYADPMYGGNKDMAGWKMKNFPGHQMSYKDIIQKDSLVKMDPKSLSSM